MSSCRIPPTEIVQLLHVPVSVPTKMLAGHLLWWHHQFVDHSPHWHMQPDFFTSFWHRLTIQGSSLPLKSSERSWDRVIILTDRFHLWCFGFGCRLLSNLGPGGCYHIGKLLAMPFAWFVTSFGLVLYCHRFSSRNSISYVCFSSERRLSQDIFLARTLDCTHLSWIQDN